MKKDEKDNVFTIAGMPNVGKSTIFNKITGMKQHTGNWIGKTVETSKGNFTHNKNKYDIIDTPGLYSLYTQSKDEDIARNFIYFNDTDKIIVVCDATNIEKGLTFLLQILEARKNILLCINLKDEAIKKGILIDEKAIGDILGIDVVYISAKNKSDIKRLIQNMCSGSKINDEYIINYSENIETAIQKIYKNIENVNTKNINKRWICIKLLENNTDIKDKISDYINYDIYKNHKEIIESSQLNIKNSGDDMMQISTETLYKQSNEIIERCVIKKDNEHYKKDIKIDNILTSKRLGIPIMLILLMGIFWITITGANYPSSMLSNAFFSVEEHIKNGLLFIKIPDVLVSILIDGVYKVVAWVVSVMLPPMAIFFPLFAILEDLGYLPRVAFNTDRAFKKCGACGKQSLTMAMGFGCNACAIASSKIIAEPKQRLIAIITNNFVPCNGRLATYS